MTCAATQVSLYWQHQHGRGLETRSVSNSYQYRQQKEPDNAFYTKSVSTLWSLYLSNVAASLTEDKPLKAKGLLSERNGPGDHSLPVQRRLCWSPNNRSIQVTVHLPFSTTRPVIYPIVRMLDCVGPTANLLG